MALRDTYKKRLKDHLKETKAHARLLERRIKKLGGKAERPAAAAALGGRAAQNATKKAAALAQGPLHATRGLSQAEKQLKNAKTEYSEEHEEIANYTAIETGQAVGDKETAKLARDIRRDEERMAKFLAGQISVMSKQVAREEIPAASARRAERNGPGRGAPRAAGPAPSAAVAGAPVLADALVMRDRCAPRAPRDGPWRPRPDRWIGVLVPLVGGLALALGVHALLLGLGLLALGDPACSSASASRACARAPRTSASWRWSRASTRRCWFLTCLRLLPPTMAAIRTITTTTAMMIARPP